MDKEELIRLKQHTEEQINNQLLPQQQRITNAIQQALGRIQLLNELITKLDVVEMEDATVVDESEEKVE